MSIKNTPIVDSINVDQFDTSWVRKHVEQERRTAELLSEVREAVFGAQDGLISTLAVVSTVGGATADPFAVLIAGLASALAGIFSMSAGEYMSSKSQREIFEAQIAAERVEVEERPAEALAEVTFLFEEEGLSREAASRVARELATGRRVLLKTMVEKELGLIDGKDENPLRGALVMGGSFGLSSLVPILPYLVLPVGTALYVSVVLTGLALFGMGVLKSRWTRRWWLRSGAEIVGLGTFAGVAGYFFGTALPALLGVAGIRY